MTATVVGIEVMNFCKCAECSDTRYFKRGLRKLAPPQGFRWGKNGDLVAVYRDGSDVRKVEN